METSAKMDQSTRRPHSFEITEIPSEHAVAYCTATPTETASQEHAHPRVRFIHSSGHGSSGFCLLPQAEMGPLYRHNHEKNRHEHGMVSTVPDIRQGQEHANEHKIQQRSP